MLDRCRKILDAEREALGSAAASTHFHLLDAECALPAAQFDFVYFFDVLVHVDVPLKASAKTTATSRHRLLVPKWGFNVERAEDFVTAAGVGMDVVPTVVAHVQTALEPFKTSQWRTWA